MTDLKISQFPSGGAILATDEIAVNRPGTGNAKVFAGSAAAADLGDFLQTLNNLSDIADPIIARVNLGLIIGTDVQAHNANLDALAGLTLASDKLPYATGVGALALTSLSAFARTLIDDADAAAMRTTLGLGSMALQAASAVAITGGSITGLGTPSANSDAAPKSYVDAATAGLSQKNSCRVATTAALTAAYSNGTSGVGATLTNSGAQAAISIDGVALAVGDRVLVKNQASALQNGIYSVTTVGSGASNWVLTRTTDYDASSEIAEGTYCVIEEGTTQAGTLWLETGSGPFTIGTTAVSFTQLTVAPQTVTFTGDVTGTGAGSIALTIGNQKVTYAKIQNVSATNKVLGRATAGAGSIEEIDLTAFGRSLIDDADASTARTTLGLGTAATQNTGTSGANLPFMNGANTWSGQQSFTTSALDLQVGQIQFPATQNASAGANVLDDYEEGTWTAAFSATSGTVTINGSFNSGSYIKIGKRVFISGDFRVSSVSGPSGTLSITGLPFAAENSNGANTAVSISASSLTASATTDIQGRILQNNSAVQLLQFAAGAQNNLAGNVQAGSDFIIGGNYLAAA